MGRQCLYGIGGAAQRAFYREPPVAGTERDEGCDERVLRRGLAATEADASARGLEVDIVHLHHLVEFQWRDPVYAGRQGVAVAAVAVAAHIVVAAVVEAIPALQRAAHHCDQGGDALAVGSHAQPADAEYGNLLILYVCHDYGFI